MKLIRVGVAAVNQTPLDWAGNLSRILRAIGEARAAGVSLLVLPELCITGYGCEDAFHSPFVSRTAWEILGEIASATGGMIVCVGLPVVVNAAVYDSAALLVDGRVAGLVAKRHLAGDGVHYEPRWFKPWPLGVRTRVGEGAGVPMGDLFFDLGGVRVGFEICEEAWVALRPGAALTQHGIDFLLNPSGSHFAFGKRAVRERFVVDGSRAFGVTYLYANLVGNEAGRILYDGAGLIGSGGKLLANGPSLGFDEVYLTTAVVDVEANRISRGRTASLRSDPGDPGDEVVRLPFMWPDVEPALPVPVRQSWDTGPSARFESFTRAVALGLFDYLVKSRARGWMVSLSGGADSAAVATLCALSLRFAVAEIGAERVAHRLRHIKDLPADPADWTARLLTTVYQATENSSEETLHSARTVALGLGATFHLWKIDALVDGYTGMVADTLGRPLDWRTDDIALQNIQARVRAPGVWMLANIEGKLLLATSNRSEAAVGYATMDGDTCGGLSPIAGIDKAYLREWLRWVGAVGPEGLGPVAGLDVVNALQPTAELRPPERHQTDEDDLMPYPVLDAIERAAIRDKLEPSEVHRLLCVWFPQFTRAMLAMWVERFFRLWCTNQWKRERYAPSFHLDDENLDPRSWCRFPILSGGFARELGQLRARSEAG